MKISALTNLNGSKIGTSASLFASWWWGELRVLVPRSLENWFADDSARVRVRIHEGEPHEAQPHESKAHLTLFSDGEEQVLGSCDLNRGSELDFESLRQTIAQKMPPGASVEVELAQQTVLTSEVFLPLATEQTLDGVIRFEMDRFTPFTAAQIGYSYRIVQRIPERDKLKLQLNVVRRDYLVELLASLSELGLSVSGVYPAQADPAVTAGAPLNLLPADLRPASVPLWNKGNRNLLAGLLLLLGAAVMLPAYWQNKRIEHLETEIAAISAEAAEAGVKQRLLVAHLEGQEILASKKNQQSTKIETIRELTELLPSTTWVSKLVVDDEDISLQGESDKSSGLIGILEQSNSFKRVAFASPVTRNAATNMERYEIRMQLAGFESYQQSSLEAPAKGGAKP